MIFPMDHKVSEQVCVETEAVRSDGKVAKQNFLHQDHQTYDKFHLLTALRHTLYWSKTKQ